MKKIVRKKKKPVIQFNPFKIYDNFKYSSVVDYEYDYYGPPDGGCECGDDYCRCQVFEGLRTKDINITALVDHLCGKNKDRYLRYCVERILRICRIYDQYSWEVYADYGYYGQEVK